MLMRFAPVSKATLDIICETAFGYKTDSLHNPHNELAVAYEELVGLQSGTYTLLVHSSLPPSPYTTHRTPHPSPIKPRTPLTPYVPFPPQHTI